MGKHRSIQERLEEAHKLAQRNRLCFEKHAKAMRSATTAGNYTKAKRAEELMRRAEQLASRWHKEMLRLMRQLRVATALAARAPTPAPGATILPMTRREAKTTEDRRRSLATAGVEWDPRTATGGRAYEVVSMGAKSRAFVNHMNQCVRKRAERKPERILAWEAIDRHFHWVHRGNMPSPSLEPSVDAARSPGVSESALDAQRVDKEFRRYVGTNMHQLLYLVVYEHRGFHEIAERCGLDALMLERLLPAALDLAAAYWRVGQKETVRPLRAWTSPLQA